MKSQPIPSASETSAAFPMLHLPRTQLCSTVGTSMVILELSSHQYKAVCPEPLVLAVPHVLRQGGALPGVTDCVRGRTQPQPETDELIIIILPALSSLCLTLSFPAAWTLADNVQLSCYCCLPCSCITLSDASPTPTQAPVQTAPEEDDGECPTPLF